MTDHPTYLAELVRRPASDLGYTDTLGLGAGGVWIDPSKYGKNYTWHVKCPADITQEMFSFTNTEGTITNSDFELVALVLQEAVFISSSASPAEQTPTLGSDNAPKFAWTFCKASTINPVVSNILSILYTQYRLQKITPSVFYHLGPLNTMADKESCRFDLSPNPFLDLFC